MSKTFTYKGYNGSVEASIADEVLHGSILFIRDLVTYEADTLAGLKAAFIEAVDDYLADCQADGLDPNKPFSGTFNVRTGGHRHKQLAVLAAQRGETINQTVCSAIDSMIKHDGQPKSVTNVHVTLNSPPVEIKREPSCWTAAPKTHHLKVVGAGL